MYYSTIKRYCRWCGKLYTPRKAVYRNGFCTDRCKAALYRARKKYVTNVELREKTISKIGNAGKRKKKKKVLTKS